MEDLQKIVSAIKVSAKMQKRLDKDNRYSKSVKSRVKELSNVCGFDLTNVDYFEFKQFNKERIINSRTIRKIISDNANESSLNKIL